MLQLVTPVTYRADPTQSLANAAISNKIKLLLMDITLLKL